MNKKIQIIVIITLFLISTNFIDISIAKSSIKNQSNHTLSYYPELYDFEKMQTNQINSITVINILVDEAYNLLNDISNGIQIPIDVRYDHEWVASHINTPYPENPKHHCYCEMKDNLTILQDFIGLYQGKEIILYCDDTSRSTDTANLLVAHNFIGVIYNMIGGMNAWIQAGYPTKANSPPNKPVISGKSNGNAGQEYSYTFTTTDSDEDKIFISINWGDGTIVEEFGPYNSGEAVIKKHIWSEKGTYIIKVKARDAYYLESNETTLEVSMPKTVNFIYYQLLLKLFEKINFFFNIQNIIETRMNYEK